MNAIVLARLLGWFSLGLGTLEVIAPATLARNLGLPGGRLLVRAFGLREIMAGFTIFGKPWSPLGPWARVAGDVMDLAALSAALGPRNRHRTSAGIATVLVAGVTALDLICAISLAQRNSGALATARRTRYVPAARVAGEAGSAQPG